MSEEKGTYEVVNVEVESKPSDMILAAVKSGADLDKLERLLALQIKWEENEAKKAYHVSMSKFKENAPDIEKDKKVSFPAGGKTTEYSHASLANVTRKINKGLSEHGLSASWTTTQTNGSVTVTCKITHSQGHSEETSLTASPDTSGSKNAIQAIGSTISYLERYTLLALTGLATSDMDDDGRTAEVKYISDTQKSTIVDMIQDTGTDEKKFLEYLKAESIDLIPELKFNVAMTALKAKAKKKTS